MFNNLDPVIFRKDKAEHFIIGAIIVFLGVMVEVMGMTNASWGGLVACIVAFYSRERANFEVHIKLPQRVLATRYWGWWQWDKDCQWDFYWPCISGISMFTIFKVYMCLFGPTPFKFIN